VTVGATSSTRRDEIVGLAGELFAAQGYATTTVREIAEAAGILSGSLYHHFDSKEAIVEELLRGFLDDILGAYRRIAAEVEEPVAALRALVHEAFDALRTHRAAVAVMLNEYNVLIRDPRFAFLRDAAEETEAIWTGVLVDGTRRGAFRSDVDAAAMYRFMRDAIWVSVRWYRPGGPRTPTDIADDYLAVLLGGIAA
jgi:TetR/AcrR family transcriptional regulator, cholesterol catabolism regulator